jgi:hypothetical protein
MLPLIIKRLAQAIRSGFERAMEDGSYQELIDQTVFTPWLKKHLDLGKSKSNCPK